MLTKVLLRELFDYDKNKGLLLTKIITTTKSKVSKIGTPAANINCKGYLIVNLFGKSWKHSTLVYAWHFGWPKQCIDHIDGVITNDKIENLRDVSQKINMMNHKRHRDGKLVGAHYVKKLNKYSAHFSIEGKVIYLGTFDTELEAHQAYLSTLSKVEMGEYIQSRENPHNSYDPSKSHISYDKQKRRFVFEISNQGKRHRKRFKTIEEATEYKNQYLKNFYTQP